MHRPTGRLGLAATLALALALIATAGAAPGAGAPAAPAAWSELALAIAVPWPGLQGPDGHFSDYVVNRAPGPQRDDYGDSMLGYGLLQLAVRTGDARYADAGFRSIAYTLSRERTSAAVAVFRYMALASAYNLANEHFSQNALFREQRSVWEGVLSRVRVTRVGKLGVTNKALVEAVEILELARTGLRSDDSSAIVRDPGRYVKLVQQFLRRDLPLAARRFERKLPRTRRAAILGDFPALPLSYHALSTGFLARAVQLLGSRAPAQARSLLRKALNASWALASPRGAVGYAGRSQDEAWTLPLTAYGAEVGAMQPGTAGSAGNYQALAQRVVARLGAEYRVGAGGLFITPALAQDLGAAIHGLDEYVTAAGYNGLTLVALNWAMETSSPVAPGRIGADVPGASRLGAGAAEFAVVRRGPVWFAVKRARSDARDLRYDAGLVALEVLSRDGTWRSVLPLRPRILGARQTAGPLLRSGRRTSLFVARSLRLARGGVTIKGGFRTRGRRRQQSALRFKAVECGARLSWTAARGRAYEYVAFLRRPAVTTRHGASDSLQSVSFSEPARVALRGDFASASDPHLVAASVRFSPSRRRTLSITVCGEGVTSR
jgi:hypothetical protein